MSAFDISMAKKVEIPEGEAVKIGIQTNQVPKSIDTDGSIFNTNGYISGYRLSSSGDIKEYISPFGVTSAATGFIPASGGDTIRIAGCFWYETSNALNYICAYDANFNFIGAGIPEGQFYTKKFVSNMTGNESLAILTLIDDENIAYIRVSCLSKAGSSTLGANMIVLNDHIFDTIWEWVLPYTNLVPTSINTDGSIYNNGLGYKDGYRVRSGGAEATSESGSCTGFIKAKAGDIVRLAGYDIQNVSASNAINVYDANHSVLGQIVANYSTAGYGIFTTSGGYIKYGWGNEFGVKQEKTGVYAWTIPPLESIAYIRVSGESGEYRVYPGSKMIVTINEEIS